jgi:hypothetical protein
MTKATITITDEGDGINVNLEFDPPVSGHGHISGAQWLAGELLKIASKIAEQAEQADQEDGN